MVGRQVVLHLSMCSLHQSSPYHCLEFASLLRLHLTLSSSAIHPHTFQHGICPLSVETQHDQREKDVGCGSPMSHTQCMHTGVGRGVVSHLNSPHPNPTQH